MKKLVMALCMCLCVVFSLSAEKKAQSQTKGLSKGSVTFSTAIKRESVMDAIIHILVEHGMSVDLINESFGLVQSDWTATSDAAGNSSFGRDFLKSMMGFEVDGFINERLKINFYVAQTGFIVSPRYRREVNFKNTKIGLVHPTVVGMDRAPEEGSKEAKLAMKIVQEINSLLQVSESVVWE